LLGLVASLAIVALIKSTPARWAYKNMLIMGYTEEEAMAEAKKYLDAVA
jgi:uncharacterized membrane protein